VRLVSTALFADLRNFTGFSERTPPDDVIAVINTYFGEMGDAVLDHGGTLLSFRGDGLVAIFGAPIECEDHADRALATAREMLDTRLPRFNAWCRKHGYDDFRIGVGISSGPMMSGNVGSARRLEYTAVGDAVNTASRMESLTKEFGNPALFTEATLELLTAPAGHVVYVDEVTLRGRTAPTRVWGLG
jgi:adenylate cyclase